MAQNSCVPQENVLTFNDLDTLIYKWQIDLPEFYKQFVLQTEALQSLMLQEVELRKKVRN